MTNLETVQTRRRADAFLPEEAHRYLAHTAEGRPIREIAREAGCHASTILRQVRKFETLRDDPLIDRVLAETKSNPIEAEAQQARQKDATQALRKLCEPGAMLLYSNHLPQPAIVKTVGEGETVVLGAIDIDLAAALVMRNWIAAAGGTTVKRYRVTSEGRSSLPGLLAEQESRMMRPDAGDAALFGAGDPDRRSRNRGLANGPGCESPLAALARRRGPDGTPFLSNDFVSAGDRLHVDYVIAGFTTSDVLGWDSPETLQPLYALAESLPDARRADAIRRTLDAVRDLGPGLSEVVLRCCCLREGLEATEKRLGWSARSGKIVLRIALQRLHLFYARTLTRNDVLIG